MEQITEKFNNFVRTNVKMNNKYIAATVSVFLAVYVSLYAPKLPEFLIKLLENPLVKILLLFTILFVNLNYEPSVSLIIAVFMVVLMLALNHIKRDREMMASVNGNLMEGVPPYVYHRCGESRHQVVRDDALLGEHGEKLIDGDVGVDGPISGVSDGEMESLRMHLNEKSPSETIAGSEFSEIMNGTTSLNFAPHQYGLDRDTTVKCTGVRTGYGSPFPNHAEVN
jgi:hypothetical protein